MKIDWPQLEASLKQLEFEELKKLPKLVIAALNTASPQTEWINQILQDLKPQTQQLLQTYEVLLWSKNDLRRLSALISSISSGKAFLLEALSDEYFSKIDDLAAKVLDARKSRSPGLDQLCEAEIEALDALRKATRDVPT